MTLDAMNKYLEDKGFKVKRERDSAHDCYIFTISKQVYDYPLPYTKISTWKYSSHRDDQLKFLNNLIDTFYKEAKSGLATMSIKEMKTWLEDKGFKVITEENIVTHVYIFVINKKVGDRTCYHRGEYTECEHIDQQIKFLNKMVDDFNRVFEQKEETTVKMIDTDIASDAYKRMLRLHLNSVYGSAGQYKPMADYFLTDIGITRKVSNMISFTIKNVIFNDPATIVFWMDGTKTVVKTQDDDIFDPEKGLAMAIAKKAYGNQGNYYNNLKKWLPEEEIEEETGTSDFKNFISNLPSHTADQWAYIAERLKDSFKEDK